MPQIDLNPIIILIVTAFISGFTLISKHFFEAWKASRELERQNKLHFINESSKSKNLFDKLEVLSKKEESYKDKENYRMMANNMAVLVNQTECSNIITQVVLNTEVKRFILFHTHNGNGQPNNLKPFKVSYLQYNAVHTSEIKNYQNLEVDNEYAKMLINIQNSKEHFVKFQVKEMNECLLKEIYIAEKMEYVEVYFLCATNTGIIYTSLGTDVLECDFKESRLKIRYAVSQLKTIFEKERNRVFRDLIEREENETRLKEIHKDKQLLKSEL